MKTQRENLNVMKGMREYSWFRPAFSVPSRQAGQKKDEPIYDPERDLEEWGT